MLEAPFCRSCRSVSAPFQPKQLGGSTRFVASGASSGRLGNPQKTLGKGGTGEGFFSEGTDQVTLNPWFWVDLLGVEKFGIWKVMQKCCWFNLRITTVNIIYMMCVYIIIYIYDICIFIYTYHIYIWYMCFHVLQAFFSGFLCNTKQDMRCYYNYTNKPKADCFCQLSGNKAPEPVESIWVWLVRFMWSFSYRSKRQNSTTTFENHEKSWKREKFAGELLSISSMMSCRDPCWVEPAVCFRGCFCPENDLGWQKITGYLIRASPDLRMATSELD